MKARGPAAQAGGIFVKQLLSDEKTVWRDPGGSWACLRPVAHYEWIDSPCQRLWHKNACGVSLCRSFFLRWITADFTHRRNNSVERPWRILSLFTIASEFTLLVCDTDKRRLCKAGRFSYGEPRRTPPLEETSLHRRNDSVERPWGMLSLFTTCLRLQVNSPCFFALATVARQREENTTWLTVH